MEIYKQKVYEEMNIGIKEGLWKSRHERNYSIAMEIISNFDKKYAADSVLAVITEGRR